MLERVTAFLHMFCDTHCVRKMHLHMEFARNLIEATLVLYVLC